MWSAINVTTIGFYCLTRIREKFRKSSELHSISIKTETMQQIGINICSLPEADSLKHLVFCINYFSKWLKPIKDKGACTITQFLHEIICRYGLWRFRLTTRGGSLWMRLAKFYPTWSALSSAYNQPIILN